MGGQMQFSEFSSELLFELGDNTETDPYRNDWINRAYRTLTTQNEFFGKKIPLYFPELETFSTDTTGDGTLSVDVPDDCHFIRTVWESSSDVKMINISWRDYIERTGRASSGSRGAPTLWTRRGDKVYFYTTPDSAYGVTIYYKKHITEMTADTDTTEIGEEWDESVLKLAVIQSMYRLKRYEDAKNEEDVFLSMVSGAASAYNHEAEDRESRRYPAPAGVHNEY